MDNKIVSSDNIVIVINNLYYENLKIIDDSRLHSSPDTYKSTISSTFPFQNLSDINPPGVRVSYRNNKINT